MTALISAILLIAWLTILLAPGRFWVIERDVPPSLHTRGPDVAVVIPARNEAALIGESLASLWRQGYPGRIRIVVVDDQSSDGTAEAARSAASTAGHVDGLNVIIGSSPPAGWAGKVWAMQQGLERTWDTGGERYVLFSDADICHGAGTLQELMARAESGQCDLVSFMVRLRCETRSEKLMIPAFVFFFRMLYPFRRVNDPRDPLAGAAGGVMLVRREALERIGGLAAIRNALIDDCSLAREIKRGNHRIWLGLGGTSRSTRGYGSLGEIIRMISRSAYTQLGYSPARLLGSVIGLALVFLAPPLLAILSRGLSALVAALAWLLMCLAYVPMLRFYRRSLFWAPLLPVTATVYLWATIRSAWMHHLGKGGEWKGRAHAK